MDIETQIQDIQDKKPKRVLSPWIMVILAGLLIILSIVLLTHPAFWEKLDLSDTGEIGDTIGGIAAPIVGLLGAFLVYVSFKEQIEANRIQRRALNKEILRSNNIREMDLFIRLFDTVRDYFEEFQFRDYKGAVAFNHCTIAMTQFQSAKHFVQHDTEKPKDLENIVSQLELISSRLLRNSFTDTEDEVLVIQLFLDFYETYIKLSLTSLIHHWEDIDLAPQSLYKYIYLQRNCENLAEKLTDKI